jgi:hypothetical protein
MEWARNEEEPVRTFLKGKMDFSMKSPFCPLKKA